jgi:hypothetical protein
MDMDRAVCEEGTEVLHVTEMNNGREELRNYGVLSKDCTACRWLFR